MDPRLQKDLEDVLKAARTRARGQRLTFVFESDTATDTATDTDTDTDTVTDPVTDVRVLQGLDQTEAQVKQRETTETEQVSVLNPEQKATSPPSN